MSDTALAPPDTAPAELPSTLSTPKPVTRIDAIDGLRAMAMFMVFTFHVWEFGDSPTLDVHLGSRSVSFGHLLGSFPTGVDLFMVLSGFCLFWPLVKSPKRLESWSTISYLKRRFHRIAPPYYAAIIFVSLLPNALVIVYRLAGRPGNWQVFPSAWQFISHFLFIHTLFLRTWTGIEGAFWSLGLEMQFYIAFPLVVFCYRKYGVRVMVGMVLISIVYRALAAYETRGVSGDLPYLVTIFFLGRWMQFAAGMSAAWIVARYVSHGKTLSAGIGSAMLLAAVAGYLFAVSGVANIRAFALLPITDLLVAAAFGAAIVALCASSSPVRKLFENRVITWLGYISYSVFLIHQNTVYYIGEFFKKVHPVSGPVRFAILETVGFVIIVGISTVFFKVCEAPFVNDPRKNSGRIS